MEIKAKCTVRGAQNYWHLSPQRSKAKWYLPLVPLTPKIESVKLKL